MGSDRPKVFREIGLLLPSFRGDIELLVKRLEAKGFTPRVFETLRSKERGQWLQERGKTKNGALSMHCYGAAADIICADKLWNNPAFYKALGEEAAALGLTWGGSWKNGWDKPHVQAIPVRLQREFRTLKPEERNAYLMGVKSCR